MAVSFAWREIKEPWIINSLQLKQMKHTHTAAATCIGLLVSICGFMSINAGLRKNKHNACLKIMKRLNASISKQSWSWHWSVFTQRVLICLSSSVCLSAAEQRAHTPTHSTQPAVPPIHTALMSAPNTPNNPTTLGWDAFMRPGIFRRFFTSPHSLWAQRKPQTSQTSTHPHPFRDELI